MPSITDALDVRPSPQSVLEYGGLQPDVVTGIAVAKRAGGNMDRRHSTQDISWFLDIEKNGQLDLEPPYQRRSVWTAKDRRFFLDTIFRNFPSPAVFLHKHISDTGAVKFFVVDGKQRLETILRFSKDKLRIASEYGDIRLNNKRFSDIAGDIDLRNRFWNYEIPVEMIDFSEDELVNNVFDRLNRNSRKLTSQELRHAKFDGWLITRVEAEAELEVWKSLGIATRARATRMMDVQFISELLDVVLHNAVRGFSQDDLNELYAEYDDLEELEDFDLDAFNSKFEHAKSFMLEMEQHNQAVTVSARTATAIYSLWGAIVTATELPGAIEAADRYALFMKQVEELAAAPVGAPLPSPSYAAAARYRDNARGASTEPAQRAARHEVVTAVLLGE